MNSETIPETAAEETVRPAVITLAPKRRSKVVRDTPEIEMPSPTPERAIVRGARMKRSGRMPVRWKGQEKPAVWISPEIVGTFNEAIGALGRTAVKQAAHAAA